MKTFIAALVLFIVTTTNAVADWYCQCGTVVHVNYQTTCPVCNRNLPNSTPPFTPPGGNASDWSGLTLGVTVSNINGRVVVSKVAQGTPAFGRLFPNDQLVKGAFRDAESGQVYRIDISSPEDLTRLKYEAGPGTQVALEVFRPRSGTRSFFVTFAGREEQKTSSYTVNGREVERSEPYIVTSPLSITEDKSGSAARMLGSDGGQSSGNTSQGSATQGGGSSSDSAADLLNGSGR